MGKSSWLVDQWKGMTQARDEDTIVALEVATDGSASLSGSWPQHVMAAGWGVHVAAWVDLGNEFKLKRLGVATAACCEAGSLSAPGAEITTIAWILGKIASFGAGHFGLVWLGLQSDSEYALGVMQMQIRVHRMAELAKCARIN